MKADLRVVLGVSTALCLLSGATLADSGDAGQGQTSGNLAKAPAVDLASGASAPATAPDQGTSLGEVIVTATRRAVDLQAVPATIDVASAVKLDELNIKDSTGIEKLVPGVTIARSGGVTPFIRGIGTFNAGFSEPSVAFYIDGVYLPNSAGVLFSFNNIERVEVLKGPQGTLYGRNTTGGLINVVTRQPSEEATIDASVGYANYDTFTQNFYGSTSISDDVAANVAIYHQKQSKGWSTNVYTGDDVQKSEDTGVYGKLQWKHGADTKVTLSALYDSSDANKGWAFAILPGTYGIDGTPYLGQYKISQSPIPGVPSDPTALFTGDLASFRIDQDFGFANFFSLTGFQTGRQVSRLSSNGIVGNPVAGQGASNTYIQFKYKTWSQELQLASKPSDSPFEWISGFFYYYDNTDVATAALPTCVGNVCSPLPGNLPPQLVDTRPTTRSYSGYGDGTFNIFKQTHLTGGVRYTYEVKGFSGMVKPYPGLPDSALVLPPQVLLTSQQAGVVPSINASKVTYRAVLAQDFADDVHTYASFNRGFKSGTYNPNVVNQQPVLPETLDAYEVGIKSEPLDRRLRLNLSAFYYDYKNIQVRSNAGLPPGSPSVAENIGAAHMKGVDGQFDFVVAEGLSINGGFEYLDAKYASYPGGSCTVPRTPSGTILGGVLATTCDLSGYPVPVSPKFSATLGFSYKVATSVGSFTWVANDSYKSRYTFVADNSIQQAPHSIVDTSVTWKPNDKYDVQLFAKNLTNQYTYAAGQNASTYVYVPGEPRNYGIVLGYHM